MESVDDFIRNKQRKNENKIVSFSTWNELRFNSISIRLVFLLFFYLDFKMFWLIDRTLDVSEEKKDARTNNYF